MNRHTNYVAAHQAASVRSRFTLAGLAGVLAIVGIATTASAQQGFGGPYLLREWSTPGITEGETFISRSPADEIRLSYTVDLGNPGPGVSLRRTTFRTKARETGRLTLNWRWAGSHAFFRARGELEVFSMTSRGRRQQTLFALGNLTETFNRTGSLTIDVEKGMDFGITVGGSNFDRNSKLNGTVTLTGSDDELEGFTGAYEPQKWSDSGIRGGSTDVDPATGASDTLRYSYDVDRGNPGPGVSRRTARIQQVADRSGRVRFNWAWTGFHAFFNAEARLRAVIDTPSGTVIEEIVANRSVSGRFQFSGNTTFEVFEGHRFAIEVSGRNSDSDSRLNGVVTLSRFTITPLLNLTPSRWSKSTIAGGTTTIAQTLSQPLAAAAFEYDVARSGGGVSFRTTTFSMTAVADGKIEFDWNWAGFHAFFRSEAVLQAFVNGSFRDLVARRSVSGRFTFSGPATLDVKKGDTFGIRVGGRNGDRDARVNGKVTVTNFSFTQAGSIAPIAGASGCGLGGKVGTNGPFAVGNESFAITLTGAASNTLSGILLLDPTAATPAPFCGRGCGNVIVPVITVPTVVRAGDSQVLLPIARNPSNVGFRMFAQWAVISPSAVGCSLQPSVQLSDAAQLTMHQ